VRVVHSPEAAGAEQGSGHDEARDRGEAQAAEDEDHREAAGNLLVKLRRQLSI